MIVLFPLWDIPNVGPCSVAYLYSSRDVQFFFVFRGPFLIFWNEIFYKNIVQAPVVQKLDSAIHRINHYPVDTY